MRTLTPTLHHQDVWTPSDVATFAGIDIKTALKLVRSLPHLRAGRRYFVARAVVLNQLGLDPDGRPVGAVSTSSQDPNRPSGDSVDSREVGVPQT